MTLPEAPLEVFDLHTVTDEYDLGTGGCSDETCCGPSYWLVTCSCGEQFRGMHDYATEEHTEHAVEALRQQAKTFNETMEIRHVE